jgi:hypothetical protein
MDVSCVANIAICGLTPFTFCNASKIFAVGFSEKYGFIDFDGTGLSKRLTGFNVHDHFVKCVVFS